MIQYSAETVCGGLDNFLESVNFRLRKPEYILPLITREIADGVAKPEFRIWTLDVDLDRPVGAPLRMDDLGAIVQGQKRIHHEKPSCKTRDCFQ
jgi:hypothetical protein